MDKSEKPQSSKNKQSFNLFRKIEITIIEIFLLRCCSLSKMCFRFVLIGTTGHKADTNITKAQNFCESSKNIYF